MEDGPVLCFYRDDTVSICRCSPPLLQACGRAWHWRLSVAVYEHLSAARILLIYVTFPWLPRGSKYPIFKNSRPQC